MRPVARDVLATAPDPVRRREFTGSGAVAINVPRHWSHAVKNEGELDLWLFNASDIDTNRESGEASDAFTPSSGWMNTKPECRGLSNILPYKRIRGRRLRQLAPDDCGK